MGIEFTYNGLRAHFDDRYKMRAALIWVDCCCLQTNGDVELLSSSLL